MGKKIWEIVERSMETGGVAMTYSGYKTQEAAEEVAAEMEKENEGYWYEVRREI